MSKTKLDTTEHPEGDSFLRRWSQRKTRIAAEESETEKKTIDNFRIAPADPIEEPPKQELTDADMPSLDSLDEHSDYSVFFSPKVSEELRRLALRKLFHSPSYNITDGLDDYAGDYTQFAKLGSLITQDMRYIAEVEAKRTLETAPQTPGEEATEKTVTARSTENLLAENEVPVNDQTPKTPPHSDEEPPA